MGLTLIWPGEGRNGKRLETVLGAILYKEEMYSVISDKEKLELCLKQGKLKGKKLLFAVDIDSTGINPDWCSMMAVLRKKTGGLEGSAAGMIVDGEGEWYTKSLAREMALTINEAGCWVIGRPLVEATGSLKNYKIQAKNQKCGLYEAYVRSAEDLTNRLRGFIRPALKNRKLLCVHSCNPRTSNTYALWSEIKKRLPGELSVREISLREGTVPDCAGCTFETCMYYGRDKRCFYGGAIVEEVFPELADSGALMVLSPNYNDAMGANLTAMVNRLTALQRREDFSEKYLFAVVVSGYSGSDIVCEQILDGLNMNKSFLLPGNFACTATAGAAGSIYEQPDLPRKARQFAEYMAGVMGL